MKLLSKLIFCMTQLKNLFNLFYLIIAILSVSCCDNEIKEKFYSEPIISEISPSLVNLDHTSEGFLVTLNNGEITHIFRQENSISGGHIGNSGGIYKRISLDNGKNWSKPEVVFNDQYDDRNIRGGITQEGYIIVFFRRLDAKDWTSIDLNYIISTDGGKTFSTRQKIDFDFDPDIWEVWIDNFAQISKNKYLLPVHGVGYCEMRSFSLDGSSIKFDNYKWHWDKDVTMPLGIDEPYICVKENKVICLFRDERIQNRTNYYQSTSSDYGRTWSNPQKTNIAISYFCPSPLIFVEPNLNNDVFVIATDRRTPDSYNSRIWIYNSNFEQVFQNSNNYKELKTISRPKPNNYVFYGYPIVTKMKNGKWLIIITESLEDGINEDTDFYQFEITV